MQTFKEFFSDAGGSPEETSRGQAPELDPRLARVKSKQLMNLRAQIAQYRAAAETGENKLSPEDVERLKHMVSKTASELEGSRLPPEAEGAARDAYRDLVAMGESTKEESVKKMLIEASETLKNLLNG